MTPPPPKKKKKKKNIQKIFIPQKIFIFLKTPKNNEIQNFEPQKIARAYVCVKISEDPPGSNLVIFNLISSKFHIWTASIKLSLKFEYVLCPKKNNQDGRQNGRRLSVSAVVVTLILSFLSDFFQISCIKLLFTSEYGFCPMNDNQDCRQNGSGHYAGPLSKSDCSSLFFYVYLPIVRTTENSK